MYIHICTALKMAIPIHSFFARMLTEWAHKCTYRCTHTHSTRTHTNTQCSCNRYCIRPCLFAFVLIAPTQGKKTSGALPVHLFFYMDFQQIESEVRSIAC